MIMTLRKMIHWLSTRGPVLRLALRTSGWASNAVFGMTVITCTTQSHTIGVALQRLWASHGTDGEALSVLLIMSVLPLTVLLLDWLKREFQALLDAQRPPAGPA